MSDRINNFQPVFQPTPPVYGPPPAANVSFFSPDSSAGAAMPATAPPANTAASAAGPSGSSSDVASAFQQLPASLQSMLVQLQSELNGVTGAAPNAASSTAPPTAASGGSASAAANSGPGVDDQPSLTSAALFAQNLLSAVQSYAAGAADLGMTAASIAAIA